jgi:hypothetical protein
VGTLRSVETVIGMKGFLRLARGRVSLARVGMLTRCGSLFPPVIAIYYLSDYEALTGETGAENGTIAQTVNYSAVEDRTPSFTTRGRVRGSPAI